MSKNNLAVTQQLSGLPMKSLIAGPLNAAAEANANLAAMQSQFLLTNCFRKNTSNPKNSFYEPIVVNLRVSRPAIDKTTGRTLEPLVSTIQLPLLTILPLNSLAVKNIDINFAMEVQSAFSDEKSQESQSSNESEANLSASIGFSVFKAEINGSVKTSNQSSNTAKEHYESSASAKYDISVNASQIPLPEGVTTIINTYAQAIAPIEIESTTPEALKNKK